MPIDTSIYNALLQRPKTVQEYDNEAQTSQMNRLALQTERNKAAEYQRGIAGEAALSNALASGGDVQNALARGGFGSKALAYVKQQQDVAKTGADIAHLGAQTGKLTQETTGLDYQLKEQKRHKAITDIAAFNSPQEAMASLKAHADAGDIPPDQAQMIAQGIPQNPADFPKWQIGMLQRIMTPDKAMEYKAPTASTVATNNTNLATNAATNARIASEGSANRANALAVQDKITARQPEPVSGTKLAPEDITTMAQQYIAGDKSVLQGLGRGTQGAEDIRAVRAEIGKQLRGSNLTGADQAAKIAEYAGMTAGMRATGNISARVENAVEEAAQLAPLALAASKDVARSGLLPFGKAQIMFDTNTNDPNLAKFATANMGLATAYASAMARGNKPTVSDMEHARSLLSTAKSQPAYEATVQQMMQEMQAAKRAPRSVRGSLSKEMSGRSEAEAAATPSTGKPSLSDIFGK